MHTNVQFKVMRKNLMERCTDLSNTISCKLNLITRSWDKLNPDSQAQMHVKPDVHTGSLNALSLDVKEIFGNVEKELQGDLGEEENKFKDLRGKYDQLDVQIDNYCA